MYILDFALIIASFGVIPVVIAWRVLESLAFASGLQTTSTEGWHETRLSLPGPLVPLQTRLIQAELHDDRLRGAIRMAAPLGGKQPDRRWPYGFELAADGRLRWRSAVHAWQIVAPVLNLLAAAMLFVPSVHLVYVKHLHSLAVIPLAATAMVVYAIGMLATRGWRTREAERKLLQNLQQALEAAQAEPVEVA